MSKIIRKAVFPVAGLGTRFLPATKASPKEMLTVVDKPLVQYAVEEAVAAGIEVMVFVTGRNKAAIPNHFDTAYELETELEARNKSKLLEIVRSIVPSHVTCVYIRQNMALGLGHAVLCAQPVVGDEPFAVVLADDLIDDGNRGCLAQMVKVFGETTSSILGTQLVDPAEAFRYGVIDPEEDGNVTKIRGMVEKPPTGTEPSNRAVVGRYLLTPRIFHHISQIGKGAGGEIQLTDAILKLTEDEDVYAYNFEGVRYDCGSKLGYLQANVDYALKHDDLGPEFEAWIRERFDCSSRS